MPRITWRLVVLALTCGACGSPPTSGSGTTGGDSASLSKDADTGAGGCLANVTTCGDRVCQNNESAACCGFDCDPAVHGAAVCIDGTCHTVVLTCRADPQCMAALDCALHCQADMTCISDCAKGLLGATQLVFKCVDPQCWNMH